MIPDAASPATTAFVEMMCARWGRRVLVEEDEENVPNLVLGFKARSDHGRKPVCPVCKLAVVGYSVAASQGEKAFKYHVACAGVVV